MTNYEQPYDEWRQQQIDDEERSLSPKQRKIRADVRQSEYDALTNDEKIARAEGRRGNSKKELARLRGEDVE